MGNAARKKRKRDGEPFRKPQKKKTRDRRIVGLGLVSRAEILAALLVRGER